MHIPTLLPAFLVLPILTVGLMTIAPERASALSCMEMGQYLTSIVGSDETVIFTGTVTDTIESADYTTEVLQIRDVSQGYVESEIMAYHQKHPDWGYLCNTGPAKKGVESLYVATRNEVGQYNVSMRLEMKESLATDLLKQIKDKSVEGEVIESSRTDRTNQIMSSIADLFKQIALLLGEYNYWMKN